MLLVRAESWGSLCWWFDSSPFLYSGGVLAEKWKQIFEVVLIPPLEGVVVQASLEDFAVLTSGFTIIELNLTPGGRPDKAMKTQNFT